MDEFIIILGILSFFGSIIVLRALIIDVHRILVRFYNDCIYKRTDVLCILGMKESAKILNVHVIKSWQDLYKRYF